MTEILKLKMDVQINAKSNQMVIAILQRKFVTFVETAFVRLLKFVMTKINQMEKDVLRIVLEC